MVVNSIKSDIYAGTTAWILVCSILIASVGLNANSTPVVIGAMLISPLMGPILGSDILSPQMIYRPSKVSNKLW